MFFHKIYHFKKMTILSLLSFLKMIDYLLNEENVYIYGSYVYKNLLFSDMSYNDIDVAVPFLKGSNIANKLKEKYNCQILSDILDPEFEHVNLDCSGVKISLLDNITVFRFLQDTNIDIFKYILTKNGIPKKFTKFNKKDCKYFKRDKDIKYFSKFCS